MRTTGTHEMLEPHELFAFKNVYLAKNIAMQGTVTDPQLQSLIQIRYSKNATTNS